MGTFEKIENYYKKYYNDEVMKMPLEQRMAYFEKCEAAEKEAQHRYEHGELCSQLYHMFPTEEIKRIINSSMYKDNKPKANNIYTIEYLPLYLHDDQWMMKYVAAVMKKYKPNVKISVREIRYLVKNSASFSSVRRQYERALSGALAEYMIKTVVPNALVPSDELTPLMQKNSPDFDSFFPKEIVRYRVKKGAFSFDVEAGLEEHIDVWLEPAMRIAFENKYYPLSGSIDDKKEMSLWWKAYSHLKDKHYQDWAKKRQFQRYKNNEQIINDFGVVTNDMKMNYLEQIKLDMKLKMDLELRDLMLGTTKQKLQDNLVKGFKGLKTKTNQAKNTVMKVLKTKTNKLNTVMRGLKNKFNQTELTDDQDVTK